MDLHDRLRQIDALPISMEARALARLAALINEAGGGLMPDEAERVGLALAMACHRAGVPAGRLRRLVDPDAAGFVRSVTTFIRPPD
ncbi:MAG TPA: hypothetical protein EYQ24_10405 [Bacteroidetes bacterium]|nr:hypothetical protein [Bacteroidota bacterium]